MPDLLRLTHDKEAAQAANATKSRYLASVSHEIRSPLNSIYGYAQLLERGGDVDPVDAGRIIRRSAEHLTNLVEGLLDMSQVENGVMKVSHDIVRLAPFLDQIANMFRQDAAAKGLTLVYDRPERLPAFVRMDQNRLRQVLINLLSNAIKFTPSGSVRLRVSYAAEVATFEISDTGPGIAPTDRERIFTPFERGSDAAAQQQPGAGLGLAITDALVRILGGGLHMESAVGAGTVFRVTMMLGQVAGHVGKGASAAQITGYEGKRRSILVVDDDDHHLSLMRALLLSLDFEVVVASRGDAALSIATARQFDLALLDISMPGLSGWETATRLRRMCDPGLRIVMLSANALERHKGDAEKPVHDLFLVKPVKLDALVDAVGAELGLCWIADTPKPEIADPSDTPPSLPEAARPHVEKIRELLRIGHIRGVEGEVKALEEAAPEARELIARLYDCLDRYDLSALDSALPHL